MATLKSQGEILGLIAARRLRRPARDLPFLDELFRRLAACNPLEAGATEDRIWNVWMDHPHRAAAEASISPRATSRRAATTSPKPASRSCCAARPASPKPGTSAPRSTTSSGATEECLDDIRRTLELEPRHFAAMLHFAEILLGAGASAEARFAFHAALTVHPHLPRAREALADKP